MEDAVNRQFVICEHTTPDNVHWDFMLEAGDTLWTWRLTVPPAEMGDRPVAAERIADHPKRFLTYEGPVQNNTGRVTIADKGTCQLTKQIGDTLTIKLHGTILNGTYSFAVSDRR